MFIGSAGLMSGWWWALSGWWWALSPARAAGEFSSPELTVTAVSYFNIRFAPVLPQ